MLSLNTVFVATLILTLLSGAAATWLATTGQENQHSRRKVADRLAQIAMLGAAAIFAMLGNAHD